MEAPVIDAGEAQRATGQPGSTGQPRVLDRPVVAVLSQGAKLPGLNAIARSALWLLGLTAVAGLLDKLLGLWANDLWLEWCSTLILALVPVGLFLLVHVAAGHGRQEVQISMRGMGRMAAKAGGLIVGVKTVWVGLVLLAMIPAVGPTLDVALWPVRLVANAVVITALLAACVVAIVTPLTPVTDRRLIGQQLQSAKGLMRRHPFVLLEAAIWLGVVFWLIVSLLDGLIAKEVAVAVFATGEGAAGLYGGAPAWIRGLMTVPAVNSPFDFAAGDDTGGYTVVLSVVLVLLHLVVACAVLGALLATLVQPLRHLVAELASLESGAAPDREGSTP